MKGTARHLAVVRPQAPTPAEASATGATVRFAPYVMVGLALVGIADAFYIAHASYTGQPLWCVGWRRRLFSDQG